MKQRGWFLERHSKKMGDIVVVGSKKLRKVLVFMSWVQSQMNLNRKDAFFTTTHDDPNLSPLIFPSPSLPNPRTDYPKDSISTPSPASGGDGGAKINPVVIFIIVILAVVFFISGLLHLLVRFLMKHRSSSSSVSESNSYPELSGSDTVQKQLQQLFHLHDLGLDQAFVDALPVFFYKEIMGLQEPFDCAVCLCEFSEQDKLRLLPNCSHAFHIDCIDTWLLSNSTCPLCRGTLFTPGLAFENPLFSFEGSREEDGLSGHGEALGGSGGVSSGHKPAESEVMRGKRVFSVILGKFRNSNEGGNGEVGETSSNYLDARRCFSMGSCRYVVADSELQVALKPSNGGASVRLVNVNSVVTGDIEGKRIINIGGKGESFSVSKIWQWSRKGKFPSPSQTHMGVGAGTGFDYSWTDRNQKT